MEAAEDAAVARATRIKAEAEAAEESTRILLERLAATEVEEPRLCTTLKDEKARQKEARKAAKEAAKEATRYWAEQEVAIQAALVKA